MPIDESYISNDNNTLRSNLFTQFRAFIFTGFYELVPYIQFDVTPGFCTGDMSTEKGRGRCLVNM